MKNINWTTLNLAFWIELILCWFLPFQTTDHFQYRAGFPTPFLTVYAETPGISLFTSTHLNPLGLLFNVIFIHVIILGCIKAYRKIRE